MILVLLLVGLYASAAEDLPEAVPPQLCNCKQNLQSEETSTEFSPTFPTTSFTCWGRYDGYYADVEVDCTIFHYCQTWHFPTGLNETVKWDFACPQSTIFNQKVLSCTPPSISFDCQESPNYYWVNYNLTTKTTTPAPAPTTELTTPVPNYGQQLIVGGIGAQSATITDSDHPSTPSHAVTSSDQEQTESVTPEQNIDQEAVETVPQSIRFPDSEHTSLPSHSVTSSDHEQPEWITPAHNFDQQQILFPDSERQYSSQFSTPSSQVEAEWTDPKHSFRQGFGGTVSEPSFFSDSEHPAHSATTLGSEDAAWKAPVRNTEDQLGGTASQPTSFSYSEHPSTPSKLFTSSEYVQTELTTPVQNFGQDLGGKQSPSFKDSEPSTVNHASTSYSLTLEHSATSLGAVQGQEFGQTELTSFPDSKLPYGHSHSSASLDQAQTEVLAPVHNIVQLLQGNIPQSTSFPIRDSEQPWLSATSLKPVDTELKDSVHKTDQQPTSLPDSEHPYSASHSSASLDQSQTEVKTPVHNIVQLLQGIVPQPTAFPDSAQPSYFATYLQPVDTELKDSVHKTDQQSTSLPVSEHPHTHSYFATTAGLVQGEVSTPEHSFREEYQGTQTTSFPYLELSSKPSHSIPLEQIQPESKAPQQNFEQELGGSAPQSTAFYASEHPSVPAKSSVHELHSYTASHSATSLDQVQSEVTNSVLNFGNEFRGTEGTASPYSEHASTISYSATSLDHAQAELKAPVPNFEQEIGGTVPQSTSSQVLEHPSATNVDLVQTELKIPVHKFEQALDGTVTSTFFSDLENPSHSATSVEQIQEELTTPVQNSKQEFGGSQSQSTFSEDSEHPTTSHSVVSLDKIQAGVTDSVPNFGQEFRGTETPSFKDSEPSTAYHATHNPAPEHSTNSWGIVQELSIPVQSFKQEVQGIEATSSPDSKNPSLSSHSSQQVEPESIEVKNFEQETGESVPRPTSFQYLEPSAPSHSATSFERELTTPVRTFGQEIKGTGAAFVPYYEQPTTLSHSATSFDQVQAELKAPFHSFAEDLEGTVLQTTFFPSSEHPSHSATPVGQEETEVKAAVTNTEQQPVGTVPQPTSFLDSEYPTLHSATPLDESQAKLKAPVVNFEEHFEATASQTTSFYHPENPSISANSPDSFNEVEAEVTTAVHSFGQQLEEAEPTSFPHSPTSVDQIHIGAEHSSIPPHSGTFLEQKQIELEAPAQNYQQLGGSVSQPISVQYSEPSTTSRSAALLDHVETEIRTQEQSIRQEFGGTEPTSFLDSEHPTTPSHSSTAFDHVKTEVTAPVHSIVQLLHGTIPQPTTFPDSAQPSYSVTSLKPVDTELKDSVHNFDQQVGETAPQSTSLPDSEHPYTTSYSAASSAIVQKEITTPEHIFRQEVRVPETTSFPDSEYASTTSYSAVSLSHVQAELKVPLQNFEEIRGTVQQLTSIQDSEHTSTVSLDNVEEEKAPVHNLFQELAPQSIPLQESEHTYSPPHSVSSRNVTQTELKASAENLGQQVEGAEPTYLPHWVHSSHSATSLDQVQAELSTPEQSFKQEFGGSQSLSTFFEDTEHRTTPPRSAVSLDKPQSEVTNSLHNFGQEFQGTETPSLKDSEPSTIDHASATDNPTLEHSATSWGVAQELSSPVLNFKKEVQGIEATSFRDSEHPSTPPHSAISLEHVQPEIKAPAHNFEEQTVPQLTSFQYSEASTVYNPPAPSPSAVSFEQVQTELKAPLQNFGDGRTAAPLIPFQVSEQPSATSVDQTEGELKAPMHSSVQQAGESVSQLTPFQYSDASTVYNPPVPSPSAVSFEQVQAEVKTPLQKFEQELEGTAPQTTSFQVSEQSPAASLEQLQTETKAPVYNFEQVGETSSQSTSFYDSRHPSVLANSPASVNEVQAEVTTSVHNFGQQLEEAEATSLPDSKHSPSDQEQTELNSPLQNFEHELAGTAPQPTSFQNSENLSAISLDEVQDFGRTELPSFPDSEHQSILSHSLTSADIVQSPSESAHPNRSPEFTKSTVLPDSRLWTVLMNPTTSEDSAQAATSPNFIESWSGSAEASGEVANDEDESEAIK